MRKILYSIFLLLLHTQLLYAQVKGKITDEFSNSLGFASIYIKGTTKGTSANLDGYYELLPEIGKLVLVFQYLGYQEQEKEIIYEGNVMNVNVTLKPSIYSLKEILVSSNQEDPAYAIIRKAIAKRKFYLKQKPNYTCDAYTKGYIRILDAPKKIMGRDIGNMNGNLDTNRKGFIYLSETVSKITFEKPDQHNEEMISSIVSGRDNGFSFNSASSVDFNLYENTSDFGKNIVSPIGDDAFSYYSYTLQGIDTSADLNTHNFRIRLTPKNKSLGCWQGEINIRDGDWSIQSDNLFITGKQIQQELFDTVYLRQIFIPVNSDSVYKIQNQVFSFKANLLGIKMEGKFVVVFSDYKLDEKIKVKQRNVAVNVLEGSNEKSRQYWDSIRPVPLTLDERKDYTLKDSIKLIRESKEYKDSLDAKNNQFTFGNLLFGYQYRNSVEKWNLAVGSPLELFHFNPIQGWAFGMNIEFNKGFKRKINSKHLTIGTQMDYGLSDEKFRSSLRMNYRLNSKFHSFIELEGGNRLVEFNSQESSKLLNEISNLYFKKNYVKYYEKQFIRLVYGKVINNDFELRSKIEFAGRTKVVNHTNYSIAKKDLGYQPNELADHYEGSLNIGMKYLGTWSTIISWSPSTKVWVTPGHMTMLGSDYPRFDFNYDMGIYTLSNQLYHKLGLAISKDFDLGSWGKLHTNLKGATLIYNQQPDIPERIFQHDNFLSVYFKQNQNDFFLALFPYAYSSNKRAASWFVEQDFQGRFLDRIPLLNKLRFKELIRYTAVSIPGASPYTELSFGLGNIGYKYFRIFRVDCVNQFYQGRFKSSYITVGITSTFGE